MKLRTLLDRLIKGLTFILAGALLTTACSTAVTTQPPQPTTFPAPPQPTSPPEPSVTLVPTAAPTAMPGFQYTLDSSSLATSIQEEMVPAVPSSSNAPPWGVLPEYTRLTLAGYPITSSFMKPQIFIYPVKELVMANQGAAQIVTSLQNLIKSPQEIALMPFLPLFNAQQVLHADLQYLDFKNGQGLRYLTQFDQAPLPINNYELFYTYQGLTNDGKYYVAAVLPVNHPSLPADQKVTGNEPPEFTSNFPGYVESVRKALNTQSPNTFKPDLTQLDAMMSSLEIK